MAADNVLKLAEKVEDVRFDDVAEALRWTTEALGPDGVWTEEDFVPTKIVIVAVDERGGKYHVKERLSSMKTSEEVALLEIAKLSVVRRMMD